MDNFEHALEKENARLREESAQRLGWAEMATMERDGAMAKVEELRAEVERLTREMDVACTDLARLSREAQGATRERDEWKARAEAAEADSAVLLEKAHGMFALLTQAGEKASFVGGYFKPAPGLVAALQAVHPGAALLERLRAAERVLRFIVVEEDGVSVQHQGLYEAKAAYDALKEGV